MDHRLCDAVLDSAHRIKVLRLRDHTSLQHQVFSRCVSSGSGVLPIS